MMQDACCAPRNINDLENTFDKKRAESEARAYLEKGADKRIKNLLAYFQNHSTKPFTYSLWAHCRQYRLCAREFDSVSIPVQLVLYTRPKRL